MYGQLKWPIHCSEDIACLREWVDKPRHKMLFSWRDGCASVQYTDTGRQHSEGAARGRLEPCISGMSSKEPCLFILHMKHIPGKHTVRSGEGDVSQTCHQMPTLGTCLANPLSFSVGRRTQTQSSCRESGCTGYRSK